MVISEIKEEGKEKIRKRRKELRKGREKVISKIKEKWKEKGEKRRKRDRK